jgi:hypothetical protein
MAHRFALHVCMFNHESTAGVKQAFCGLANHADNL